MVATATSIDDRHIDDLQGKVTQKIVLQNVSWQTYQALLTDMGDHRAARLTYDQGTLEIKMPSNLHEIINRLLARMVTTLTEELGLNLKDYGSTTLDREDLEKGVEPDSCFYIQNADRVQGLNSDTATDPPPDLAIEVDITSASTRRMKVYQQLGIPEVWRYTKKGLTISQLQNGEYVECEFSPTFVMISPAMIAQFLQLRETTDDNAVIRALRTWLREQTSQE